jgi:hypothetical protein
MKVEKKLIACSILALIIGVSSVLPLVFLMSATAKAETSNESWFSITVPYSYWMTKNGTLEDVFSGFHEDLDETRMVSHQELLAFNITLNVDTTNELSDARIEYYQIDLTSDTGLIQTMHLSVGTNTKPSITREDIPFGIETFHFMRDDWFDTLPFTPYGGGGGILRLNWTAGVSMLWPMGGSGSGTLDSNDKPGLVSGLRAAETLSITVYRIGWVTFSGNSTTVTLTNKDIVDQIQLEKYGEESWLYNTLVPEDELAEIDLLHPVSFEELNFPT